MEAAPQDSEVVLEEGNVRLRPFRPADASRLYDAVRESIADVSPWLPWCHANYSIEESRNWIEHCVRAWELGEQHPFAIEIVSSGTLTGGAGLHGIDRGNRFAGLGYWVRSSETGKGLATAAARLAARFGFEGLGLERIEILTLVDNVASRRVALKLGAIEEGLLRNRIYLHGSPRDAVVHGLLPSDLSSRSR